jgi:signal transduction histidine kinase
MFKMPTRAHGQIARSEVLDTLDALRAQSIRDVLYLSMTLTFIWYVWMGIRFPAQTAPDHGLLIVPIIILAWICLNLARQGAEEQPVAVSRSASALRLAVAIYLGGSMALITLGIWLYQAASGVMLYPILALAAVVISGPGVGLIMILLNALAMAFLSYYGGMVIGASAPIGLVLLWSVLMVALGWMLSRRLELAVTWSLTSYEEARENLRETRQRRAEVLQLNQELRRAQERIERANASLVRAWRAAEEAERRQKQMTAFISHELRTPLNLVIGFSEMLATSPETYALLDLPPRARRDLYAIYRSAQQVAELLDDVLDMATMDAGHLAMMRVPADLAQVIDEAATLVRDFLQSKDLTLRVESDGEPTTVLIDRLRIRQVLLNLLVNAIRFTERGTITVQTRFEEHKAQVLVHDTGAGISPERLERMFREFESTQVPTDDSWARGTGLGLPLSRRLVEMHGGEMGVRSVVGQGSTFWFTVPVALAGEEDLQFPSHLPMPSTPDPHARPSVVVLDEHGLGMRRLARWMEGYHLVRAQSWPEALHQADELRAVAVVTPQPESAPDMEGGPAIIHCPLDAAARWARELGVDAYLRAYPEIHNRVS